MSWLEEHGAESVEPEKARRIVERRKIDLWGDNPFPRVGTEHASSSTFDRWRQIHGAWPELWPQHIAPATKHSEVTQSRCLKWIRQRHGGAGGPLPDGTYRTLVADPPWRYDNRGTRGAAEDHYGTLSLAQLIGDEALSDGSFLPKEVASRTADDAHLYLWTTNSFLRPAFDVVEAWGFEYKTCLTWVKPQIGLGNYFRNSTEHVLFALKGALPTNVNDVPTHFQARRTKHSKKPDLFLDIVETASPGPYLEMFARRRRMGWDVWGNEA